MSVVNNSKIQTFDKFAFPDLNKQYFLIYIHVVLEESVRIIKPPIHFQTSREKPAGWIRKSKPLGQLDFLDGN